MMYLIVSFFFPYFAQHFAAGAFADGRYSML
jgi:hypothetical protein